MRFLVDNSNRGNFMTMRAILAVLLMIAGAVGHDAAAATVLRVSPHANLQVLDPHSNTATITIMHAHLIYDTLFAWDEALRPQPEMVESYTVSPDRLIYAFVLRPGQKFHDGQKVTSADVVASIKRWAVRDTLGQLLAAATAEMVAIDDARFEIRLKEPFNFVAHALSQSSGNLPPIMHAQVAATEPLPHIQSTS